MKRDSVAPLWIRAGSGHTPQSRERRGAQNRADQIEDVDMARIITAVLLLYGLGMQPNAHAAPDVARATQRCEEEVTSTVKRMRGREAQEDVAAARELAKAQQAAIVEKIGVEVSRHTGELVKLVDRSDRHGELLSRVAAKIGVGLVLAILLAVAAGKAYSFYVTAAPSCRCDPPCPSGMRCTCSGCQEVKTTTTTSVASKPHSALGLDMYANIASFNCASASSACN